MSRRMISILLLIFLLGCNLPIAKTVPTKAVQTPVVLTGPGVVIVSPQNGTTLPGNASVQVQYLANGGPFIEIDLMLDNSGMVATLQNTQAALSGTLTWDKPTPGAHLLTVEAVTAEKNIYTATVNVIIGASPAGVPGTPSVPQFNTQIPQAGLDRARQRVVQILMEKYGLNMTAPPVGRKSRPGVTTDPWVSAIYYKDLFISISLYTDGTEAVSAYPVNHADPGKYVGIIDPNSKSGGITMCRPSGIIKLLVVFVDYQNLGVTQPEAFDALAQAVAQINGRYAEASRAVGQTSPILQLQATGAFITPPPAMQDYLLTPAIVTANTGYDVSKYDVLVQVDLDAQMTYATKTKFNSYGFGWGGCGNPPATVNTWIGIQQKGQLYEADDARLRSTLGHELLHNMGYPIGKTGVHEWVCGDGSLPDGSDQCDQNSLPTLMMGWTDTDGDGVIEILDPTTPYGLQTP